MKDTLITKKRLAALAAAVLLMPCFMTFAEDEDLQGQLSDVQSQMEQQQQKKGLPKLRSVVCPKDYGPFRTLLIRL